MCIYLFPFHLLSQALPSGVPCKWYVGLLIPYTLIVTNLVFWINSDMWVIPYSLFVTYLAFWSNSDMWSSVDVSCRDLPVSGQNTNWNWKWQITQTRTFKPLTWTLHIMYWLSGFIPCLSPLWAVVQIPPETGALHVDRVLSSYLIAWVFCNWGFLPHLELNISFSSYFTFLNSYMIILDARLN